MTGKVRVVIADDSATVRAALVALLASESDLLLVGQAADGVEAVALAKSLRPDVMTVDLLMPRLDGLGAIVEIMAEAPVRILVVSSAAEDRELNLTFKAIAAGALEVIGKPGHEQPQALRSWGRRVAQAIRLMAEVPVVRRRRASSLPPAVASAARVAALGGPASRARIGKRVDAFAIAASSGGPPAVASVLAALPRNLPIPLFVAQHITEGFAQGLVRWLSGMTALTVVIARAGEPALPGRVYLPPDGCDLVVDYEGVLRTPVPIGTSSPSCDRLLTSLADAYGDRAGGAVLTGMGGDGARGLLAIRDKGGATLAQDEATCVVFGMPRVAQTIGAVRELVPLAAVAPLIRAWSEA
jgi:two-component system chemotaxis response regulator CheB